MSDSIPTYAVIPTEGRPCLHDCVAALRDQVDLTVLVCTNGYDGLDVVRPLAGDVAQVWDEDPVPNISRWWNLGLDRAREAGPVHEEWNVLVINDDTIMGPGSVAKLAEGLRAWNRAQMAFPGPWDQLFTEPGPDRVTGWCFMLRGEGGLRADERLKWWTNDNNLDWDARLAGGTAMVTGVDHEHLHPNGYTNARPDLMEQAGRDMELFVQKWGRAAW